MKVLELLATQQGTPRIRLLGSAFVAGVGSVVLLALVNIAAEHIARSGYDQVDWPLAIAFALTAAAFFGGEFYLVARLGADMETVIDQFRVRLLNRIRRADYAQMERVGQERLFESITQTTQTLSQNTQYLAQALRSAILTVSVLIYILWLSPLAFCMVLAVTLVGGWLYAGLGQRLMERYQHMMVEEAKLFEGITGLFDGIKEIRLSSARSEDFGRAFTEVTDRATAIRTDVQIHGFQQFIFGQVAFYTLLAVVVFVVPTYADDFRHEVVKVTTAVLFMIGPVGVLIQTMAILAQCNAAAERMLALDRQLGAMADASEVVTPRPLPQTFDTIHFKGLEYTYPAPEGEQPFAVGPIHLQLRRGEIVFVTGGNGSGKSTFMKLLTGLYTPHFGKISVDGEEIGPSTLKAWRGMFATVFTDFHLFQRLHGVPELDSAEARQLLQWLEIDKVTAIDGDHFAHINLSTGQRKRLALLVALLEKRPILVLDEWAADQDPHFRRFFYYEILPELKRRGLTVIAVTHDDHYFDAADRRVHLEEGQLTEIKATRRSGEVV
ncbi:hypothetical protein WH50_10955 [Pokkaliibacter plantistimulans]|uniref:Peptide ABC transporter n=1 Tax=Pokkaliibacter plantistimulans TaxID=1635171 RepID=A0ABX5LZS5_9GAMM|nr:cyclic peptide export ABC transporter [Pokkaliibacter plantistimulans]PXF31160.1 hypothetical protein WH50_10955 [Pokkaliibacter plantistimulans]